MSGTCKPSSAPTSSDFDPDSGASQSAQDSPERDRLSSNELFVSKVQTVGQHQFESEFVVGDLPLVVEFYSPLCESCRELVPMLERVAEKFDGQVMVCKVNGDEQPQISKDYGVVVLPTILLINDRRVIRRFFGVPDESLFCDELEEWVGSQAAAD